MKFRLLICPKCKKVTGTEGKRKPNQNRFLYRFKPCKTCLFIAEDVRESKLIPQKTEEQSTIEGEMRKYLYDLDMLEIRKV